MNKGTGDFDVFMKEHIHKIMMLVALLMAERMLSMMEEQAKKKLTEVLGHEPTPEQYQYYQWLQRLKANWEEARREEIDQQKIYRLVMGSSDAANQTE